ELGGTKCVCVLATAAGNIIAQETVPTDKPDKTLPAIRAILRGWYESQGSFSALGIASFGPLNVIRGSADWGKIGPTPKAGWSGISVTRELGREFDVPCALDTDVTAAALSEMRWGKAAGLRDFAYVTVGTGVGVGLISNGAPIYGFGHGELGHMRIPRVKGDTWEGSCAFHGDCVEGLAAGPALSARTGIHASQITHDDPVWDYVGHAIAQMLHNIILTATPRRIFVGGGVATKQPQLFPIIHRELKRSLNGYLTSVELDHLEDYVTPPSLGALAGPLGPIALACGVAGHTASRVGRTS
ncbi:MAG: ROK family protein, partial [Pontixanthobacter sp.]